MKKLLFGAVCAGFWAVSALASPDALDRKISEYWEILAFTNDEYAGDFLFRLDRAADMLEKPEFAKLLFERIASRNALKCAKAVHFTKKPLGEISVEGKSAIEFLRAKNPALAFKFETDVAKGAAAPENLPEITLDPRVEAETNYSQLIDFAKKGDEAGFAAKIKREAWGIWQDGFWTSLLIEGIAKGDCAECARTLDSYKPLRLIELDEESGADNALSLLVKSAKKPSPKMRAFLEGQIQKWQAQIDEVKRTLDERK